MPGYDSLRIAGRLAALFAGVLWLQACSQLPERPADLVLDNGYSGGSALATSPDSSLVAAGALNGMLRVWHLEDGVVYRAWGGHAGPVTGLAFLGTGRLLTAGYDGRLATWTADGRLLRRLDTGKPITAFAIRPDRERFATGHVDGSVRLWRADMTLLNAWTGLHQGGVRSVAFEAGSDRLASSGDDRAVFLWSATAPPRRLDDPPSDARVLQFEPGGGALLGAGWFRLFRWDLDSGALVTLPTDHGGIINDIEFMADGRLASISRQTDSAVLLLDSVSGRTLDRLQRHALCGTAVAPSPDGRYLATTSDDASVRIWRLHRAPGGSSARESGQPAE
ncbi:MAG: hypothetical protein KDJ33_07190 [Gammaproteobacteria bacterium]|nr:hypothetical protein [Gammaproteobacteria bacterium]